MSDAPTTPVAGPGPPGGPGGPSGTVIAAAAAALVLLLLILMLVLASGRAQRPDPAPSPQAGSPSEEPSPTTPPTTPPATPSVEPSPSPASPAEREPTDSDAAAFAAGYQPPGEQARSVQADVDGDGSNEVVFASITGGATRIDVAAWDGVAYRVVFVDQGGFADRIDGFFVRDFTFDRTREIVTVQAVGVQGQSLSIWGHDGRGYARQPAHGGCWSGSHTYGGSGAAIEPGRITATCELAHRPVAAQPSAVYEWDGAAWVHVRTVEPGP
ncbi:MAG TPA: hypothetical protein VG452_03340 [Egibacteraceae bacterium]|nr:hypothetical protein [Egibacteraceae bacterium]